LIQRIGRTRSGIRRRRNLLPGLLEHLARGQFLRRSKLDELAQLINVLVGDMSIVGPRPEVPEFMEFYTPDQRAILIAMRPGITDYAAILLRDESSLLDGERDPVDVYRRVIMPAQLRLL
jgi:lipopolysaccharide/colanic/teichoic acid biosynthesis glycosyltransferase